MYVFNYKINDREAFTYYWVRENEDYKRNIVKNAEYDFILTDSIPKFDIFGELYPVVDEITSVNENGHKVGTLKLVPHIQSDEGKREEIRYNREQKCFPIINRGKLWYDKLTDEQLKELGEWYVAWLNAPETMIEPADFEWIK